MVKLTCLLKRKPGLTPEEFHAYWKERHGPLMAASQSGSHVLRYEQNPKPLSAYSGEGDDGYDGVTVQWFESMAEYQASVQAPDMAEVMTTTRGYSSRASLMICVAFTSASADPTDVPPNFITSVFGISAPLLLLFLALTSCPKGSGALAKSKQGNKNASRFREALYVLITFA